MQRKPQLQPYRVDLRVGVLPPDAAALGETEWSKAHRVGQTSDHECARGEGGEEEAEEHREPVHRGAIEGDGDQDEDEAALAHRGRRL